MIRSLRPLLVGSVAALIFGACDCGGPGPGPDGGEIVPTHLAFSVQPTSTIAGVSISPSVKVALQDDGAEPPPAPAAP